MIQIGAYILRPISESTFWIQLSSGEGMEVRVSDFEAVLRKFVSKNF